MSDSVRPHRRQPPGSPSLGFSRQEHWSGLPFLSPMHESEKWKWSLSVVSNPQWPHGLQPSRLLRPWDSPGKSTGVGCHSGLSFFQFQKNIFKYCIIKYCSLSLNIKYQYIIKHNSRYPMEINLLYSLIYRVFKNHEYVYFMKCFSASIKKIRYNFYWIQKI